MRLVGAGSSKTARVSNRTSTKIEGFVTIPAELFSRPLLLPVSHLLTNFPFLLLPV